MRNTKKGPRGRGTKTHQPDEDIIFSNIFLLEGWLRYFSNVASLPLRRKALCATFVARCGNQHSAAFRQVWMYWSHLYALSFKKSCIGDLTKYFFTILSISSLVSTQQSWCISFTCFAATSTFARHPLFGWLTASMHKISLRSFRHCFLERGAFSLWCLIHETIFGRSSAAKASSCSFVTC